MEPCSICEHRAYTLAAQEASQSIIKRNAKEQVTPLPALWYLSDKRWFIRASSHIRGRTWHPWFQPRSSDSLPEPVLFSRHNLGRIWRHGCRYRILGTVLPPAGGWGVRVP